MRDFRNVDHKPSYTRLKGIQHVFTQAEKGRINDHSPGDFDPNDVVSGFGADFHDLNLISACVPVKDLCVDRATLTHCKLDSGAQSFVVQ